MVTESPDAELTPREQEVFGLIAEGLSYAAIGTRLGISPRTVESHVTRIHLKIGGDGPPYRSVFAHAIRSGGD